MSIRLSKADGIPVKLVKAETPEADDAGIVAVKTVDLQGYYSLSRDQLAEKVGLSGPRTTAMIRHLGIRDNPTHFREFQFGGSRHARYSPRALQAIREGLEAGELEKAWQNYSAKGKLPSS